MNDYYLKRIRKPIPKLVLKDTNGQELFSFVFTEESEEILTADMAGSKYGLIKNIQNERTSYQLKKDDFLFSEFSGGGISMLHIKSIISDEHNKDINVELGISAHISFWTKQPSLNLFYDDARLFKIKHTFFNGWELESAVAEDDKNFNNFLFTFISLFVTSHREIYFRVMRNDY